MKKIFSLILTLVVCFGIFQTAVVSVDAADGDEIRSAKKIISVVYDDSGSMDGDRWVYASYAMQALTALLNEQDELYITYMSRSKTASRVDLTSLPRAVENIRNWDHTSGTPAASLDTAKAKLDSITDDAATTQYWLVILTDGEIADLDMTIQNKLNSFAGYKMANNSSLNVAYLAMGSGAVAATSDTGKGLYTFEAENSSTITGTMSDIANLISGRITADKINQVDDRTISFNSSLPLYSISILSQDTAAEVANASSPEETLNIDRNISLEAFNPFETTDLTLSGNAAVINMESRSGVGQVIQAGTYTITFSEPVDADRLVVQYEPAIGLKLVLTQSGVQVNDPSSLIIDDKVSVEMIPVIPGTDQRIEADTLPKNVSWSLEYLVDDHIVDSSASNKLAGITITEGKHIIRGIMQIPGFAPTIQLMEFDIIPIVYNFGISTEQPDPLVYYRKGNENNSGENLIFRVTNDGAALTKAQQKSIGVKLEVTDIICDNSNVTGFLNRFGTVPADCTLKLNDDGSYVLTPNPVVPFTAFLMMAGEYTVTVTIDRDPSVTATGTFSVIAQLHDWIDLAILIAILIFLIYLIYIFFIKYKFTGQTVCYDVYKPRYDGTGVLLVAESQTDILKPLAQNLFTLSRACKAQVFGLTLVAGPDGTVIVTGKSIAEAADQYGDSSMKPTTSLSSIAASLHPTRTKNTSKNKTKEEPNSTDLTLSSSRPIYFRNDGCKNIWCVYLQE